MSNQRTLETVSNNLIGIYQRYLDLNITDPFSNWIKTDSLRNEYNRWKYDIALLADLEENNSEYSVLIDISKNIVEQLKLPKERSNLFAAQVDILQELEGMPYYGALHTAELLTMIMRALNTNNINKLIRAFGETDLAKSALFLKSPAKTFTACGANWKPGNLNLIKYYNSENNQLHQDAIMSQFLSWHRINKGWDECLSTYNGNDFPEFCNKIKEESRFGSDAKMYWIVNDTLNHVTSY